jgi:hypothetical protein
MPTDEVITWHSTPTRASSMGKLVRIQLWIGVLHWTKTCLIQFLSRFSHKLANIPPLPTQKGIGSILMSTICLCQSFWEFPNLGFEDVLMLPVHTTISVLTTHSSDSGFLDEAINYIPVFFWLSPVLCVWMSAASVTFFSKMLPKTNRGCTKPTFQFVLQLYFSCYRHIQTRPSFALEPKVF